MKHQVNGIHLYNQEKMAAPDEKSGDKSGKLGFGSTNYAEHGCDTLSTRTWKETIKVLFPNAYYYVPNSTKILLIIRVKNRIMTKKCFLCLVFSWSKVSVWGFCLGYITRSGKAFRLVNSFRARAQSSRLKKFPEMEKS